MKAFLLALVMVPALSASLLHAEAPADAFYERVLPQEPVALLALHDAPALLELLAQLPAFADQAEDFAAQRLAFIQRFHMIAALVTGLDVQQQLDALSGGVALALLKLPHNDPAPARLPLLAVVDLSGLPPDIRATMRTRIKNNIKLFGAQLGIEISVQEAGNDLKLSLGESIVAVFRDDSLLIGFEQDINSLPALGNLAENPRYQAMRRHFAAGAGVELFGDVNLLLGELERRFADPGRRTALRVLGIDNAMSAGHHVTIDGGAVVDRFLIELRPEKTSWACLLPGEQSEMQSARFVPASFDVHISADLGLSTRTWDAMLAAISEVWGADVLEMFEQQLLGMAAPFGVRVREDIAAIVEGEIFLASEVRKVLLEDDVDELGDTPYLFGFKISDRQRLEETIAQLLASQIAWEMLGIETTATTLGDDTLVELQSMFELRPLPAYSIVDGWFLFAPSRDVLRTAITAYREGDTLNNSEDYRSLKEQMPREANIELFARTDVIYREMLEAYGDGLGERHRNFAQWLAPQVEGVGGSMASISFTDDGIVGVMRSPAGLFATIDTAIAFREAALRVQIEAARRQIEETAEALDVYRVDHGHYPVVLDLLVPDYLPAVKPDPFGVYGMPLRYHAPQRGGFVLASSGPNRQMDFDVVSFDPAQWEELIAADDDAVVAELKATIYQFKPDEHPDESGLKDDGDIVFVRTVEGGAK